MAPSEQELGQSWLEYRRLVLNELERIGNEVEKANKAIADLKTAVALLKLRAGLWGALAGTIPITLYLAIRAIANGK